MALVKPLINPSHYGRTSDNDTKIKRLQLKLDELTARVEALEQKRGPGRPPKQDAA